MKDNVYRLNVQQQSPKEVNHDQKALDQMIWWDEFALGMTT